MKARLLRAAGVSSDGKMARLVMKFGGTSVADIERIRSAVEARVAPIGHKVSAVVNYDRFHIEPDLIDAYAAMVKKLVATYYSSVTRYTSSTFLRLQLGAAFTRSEQAPRMYGSVGEAQAGLDQKPD